MTEAINMYQKWTEEIPRQFNIWTSNKCYLSDIMHYKYNTLINLLLLFKKHPPMQIYCIGIGGIESFEESYSCGVVE